MDVVFYTMSGLVHFINCCAHFPADEIIKMNKRVKPGLSQIIDLSYEQYNQKGIFLCQFHLKDFYLPNEGNVFCISQEQIPQQSYPFYHQL